MKFLILIALALSPALAFGKDLSQSISVAYTAGQRAFDVSGYKSVSAEAVLDVDTPSAKTFAADTDVSDSNDTITKTAHGLYTGLKGQLTSTDTLPGGLSTSTDYYVIVVTVDTFKLASSLADALEGTAVDITDSGTAAATHTFTPTSVAGGSIKLEGSNSGSNWTEIASAQNVTADGNIFLEEAALTYRYVRVYHALTAGHVSGTVYFHAK